MPIRTTDSPVRETISMPRTGTKRSISRLKPLEHRVRVPVRMKRLVEAEKTPEFLVRAEKAVPVGFRLLAAESVLAERPHLGADDIEQVEGPEGGNGSPLRPEDAIPLSSALDVHGQGDGVGRSIPGSPAVRKGSRERGTKRWASRGSRGGPCAEGSGKMPRRRLGRPRSSRSPGGRGRPRSRTREIVSAEEECRRVPLRPPSTSQGVPPPIV